MSRPNCDFMDRLCHQEHAPFKVLDKGYIKVIDYMGNDKAFVQAARVSYGDGTKTLRDDQGLINYLMRNNHTSPFEMCEIKIEVKLPIFVRSQWIRHRTANANEISGRYTEIKKGEFSLPEIKNLRLQSKDNKQCSGDRLDNDSALACLEEMKLATEEADKHYRSLLERGLSREMARTILPLNQYTRMYWKIDTHNLLGFLQARMHDHAQKEIRDYANVIYHDIVKPWLPMLCNAFENYRLNSVKLSANQLDLIKMMGDGLYVPFDKRRMSKDEYKQVVELVNIIRANPSSSPN